jgi:hypothetical protein
MTSKAEIRGVLEANLGSRPWAEIYILWHFQDVESLIGSHFSSGRYISPIELGKLNHSDLWAIVTAAARRLA